MMTPLTVNAMPAFPKRWGRVLDHACRRSDQRPRDRLQRRKMVSNRRVDETVWVQQHEAQHQMMPARADGADVERSEVLRASELLDTEQQENTASAAWRMRRQEMVVGLAEHPHPWQTAVLAYRQHARVTKILRR